MNGLKGNLKRPAQIPAEAFCVTGVRLKLMIDMNGTERAGEDPGCAMQK
jgi:hypothetical protein